MAFALSPKQVVSTQMKPMRQVSGQEWWDFLLAFRIKGKIYGDVKGVVLSFLCLFFECVVLQDLTFSLFMKPLRPINGLKNR